MDTKTKIEKICKVLSAKKASAINIIDVRGLSDVADYFIVCSGNSAPQVKSLALYVEEELEKENEVASRKEGTREGRWVALDYNDIILHVFHSEARSFYQLDKLWSNNKNVVEYID